MKQSVTKMFFLKECLKKKKKEQKKKKKKTTTTTIVTLDSEPKIKE